MAICIDEYFPLNEDFFDAFVDDSEFLDAMQSAEYISSAQSIDIKPQVAMSKKSKDIVVVKSKKKETNFKFRNKIFRPRGGEIDNNAAINSIQYRKQLRRRGDIAMLYAFPSFDRCDSLLFLPTTMTRHLNTGDMPGFSQLLSTYMDKNCAATVSYLSDETIKLGDLLKFHSLLNEVNPDAIVCVHNTKVIANQILATAYTKYTANKTVYDSVARSTKDPLFEPMFGLQRDASIMRNIERERRSSEEKSHLLSRILGTNPSCDLLLYMRLDLVFTFDDTTKKITHYGATETITSVEQVCTDYS